MSLYLYAILLAAGLTLILGSLVYGFSRDKPATRYARAAVMAGAGVFCCALSTLLLFTIGVTL